MTSINSGCEPQSDLRTDLHGQQRSPAVPVSKVTSVPPDRRGRRARMVGDGGTGMTFSNELEAWLASDATKTLAGLQDVFGDRSFAVTIFLLMAPTALPLPTGGLTYVLEVTTILLCLEMLSGRRTVWLPDRLQQRELGDITTGTGIPTIARIIRWCERWSRPRGGRLIEGPVAWRISGLLLGALTTAAMLAPPFSGLDTLPALGVVLVALAILLRDVVLATLGLVVGVAGTLITVTLGTAALRLLRDLF